MYMQFNHVNSLSLIARAHQLVQEGYKYMFDEALATVWSAPNYCYRCGNMAAILIVRENGARSFTVFGPAEENERDTAQQRTRRAVSFFSIHLWPSSETHIQNFLLKREIYHISCRSGWMSHIDSNFQCTLNSIPLVNLISVKTSVSFFSPPDGLKNRAI
jgi:hypothetical protein